MSDHLPSAIDDFQFTIDNLTYFLTHSIRHSIFRHREDIPCQGLVSRPLSFYKSYVHNIGGVMKNIIITALCLIVFYGCASSKFTSYPEGAKVHIAKTDISGAAPVEGYVPRTTFGKYFVKISKEGTETMYGILPLHVSPGVIILDALFLAPPGFL